jgi:hypothetical protein
MPLLWVALQKFAWPPFSYVDRSEFKSCNWEIVSKNMTYTPNFKNIGQMISSEHLPSIYRKYRDSSVGSVGGYVFDDSGSIPCRDRCIYFCQHVHTACRRPSFLVFSVYRILFPRRIKLTERKADLQVNIMFESVERCLHSPHSSWRCD